MRKVLIVSPHFPPINAPDHQRVRMAIPYLEQFGWRATVLAVDPDYVEGLHDPLLAETLPPGLRVVRTKALSFRWTRRLGVGSLAYRAGRYLKRAGDDLLRQEKFDLAFFSTTVFPVMAFGPLWAKEFNVPYILDFQDPWLSDYYEEHPEQRPPGGKLKYEFSRSRAKREEPPAVRGAAHIISVSPEYPKMFQRRYPELPDSRFTALPIGAAESDFDALSRLNVRQWLFDPNDGRVHWVYIGRGGADMGFALRAFFTALHRFFEARPEMRSRLQIHFAGTDYAPKELARKTVEPVAHEFGLGDVVNEQTDRIPYFEALRSLSDAHALIVPGSDDPGYTASKIYPYILAGKPLLAIFHEHSSVTDVIRSTRAGTIVTFESAENVEPVANRILECGWIDANAAPVVPRSLPATDWNAFAPYTACEMTRQLCEVFDGVVATSAQAKKRSPAKVK